MADRMTSIHLPGLASGSGLADWGRQDAATMIAQIRRYALQQKEWAEAILAAADEDFMVNTYVGVHVQRNREIIQKGRPTT
jgi:hypothetical protein